MLLAATYILVGTATGSYGFYRNLNSPWMKPHQHLQYASLAGLFWPVTWVMLAKLLNDMRITRSS